MQTEKLFQLANGHWILPSSVVHIYVYDAYAVDGKCYVYLRTDNGHTDSVPFETMANAVEYCRILGNEFNQLRTSTEV